MRRHTGPEPVTLAGYRQRYACYRTDPDLQAAHALPSWLFTWDDHEVDNNYANDQSQDFDDPAQFLLRRAAAYQAYYEMMPLRGSAWLRNHLRDSGSRWNVLAQQTLFAEFNRGTPQMPVHATDGWGGYPAARDRIVQYLQDYGTANPVFIGGDVHSYWVTDIKADWRDAEEWRTAHRSMPDARVVDPNASLSTARSFVVENGRAGAQRV